MSNYQILCGDIQQVLAQFPDNTLDGLLTDPPYGIPVGIRDDIIPIDSWKDFYRVLKPGAAMMVFGGARTYHRQACAMEDAGFKILDSLMWMYGCGQSRGQKSRLKPAFEPITFARKPPCVAIPLRIDEHRVGEAQTWPPNVILDEETSQYLDHQVGRDVSRIFYSAKVGAKEREAGCEALPTEGEKERHNHHPAVKPIDLNRWLSGLILPPGRGALLVPYCGSGSEVIGGLLGGWDDVLGVDVNQSYVDITRARVQHWCPESKEFA